MTSKSLDIPARPSAKGDTVVSPVLAVVLLGLITGIAYSAPEWLIWNKGGGIGGSMPALGFFAVAALALLRRCSSRIKSLFPVRKVLAVFAVLTVSLGMFHAVSEIIALIPAPYYYATPENDYRGHFLTEMPAFLVPFDPLDTGSPPDGILRFYRGSHRGETVPWGLWVGPLGWWLALVALLFLGQFCLGSLLRKQWQDHEKLLFPHVSMVTSLVEEEGGRQSVTGNRLFWFGAAASGLLFLLEGLNHYNPGIPTPGLTKMSMQAFLSEEPWASMHDELAFQPFIVAVSYLLTTEITLSIWLFAVIDNFLRALGSALVLTEPVRDAWFYYYPNTGADAVGAIFVFVGAMGWTARRHLKNVWEHAVGRAVVRSDSSEGMSYSLAFWGMVLSVVGVGAWCAMVGVSLWFCALVFLVYAVCVVFVSRLLCETGLLTASAQWMRPHMVVIRWLGFGGPTQTDAIIGHAVNSPYLKSVTVLSYLWPTVLTGGHLMPALLTGYRALDGGGEGGAMIGPAGRRDRRRFLWLAAGGLVIGLVVFAWRMLSITYERGALNSEYTMFQEAGWVFGNAFIRDVLLKERSQVTDWTEVGFMLGGAAVMGGLLVMRRSFYWWPIHPIGYIAAQVHKGIWFSVFVGWFVKRSILKYGGGEGYKRMLPFFIGLFAGQYAMTIFWYLVGWAAGEAEVHALRI
jgi:hypothetical protein